MSICVFGSLNLDIALRLPVKAAWGQTVLVGSSEEAVGGKGLNQAIAAARFGSAVSMAGAVGNDAAGMRLRTALGVEGVATTYVDVLDGRMSGRATILIEPGGDNMIAVEAGANLAARADKAIGALSGGVRVLLAQLENDVGEIAALFASSSALGCRKILNAAPAIPAGSRLFELADVLVFNQSEFADYLGLDCEPDAPEDLAVAQRLITRPDQAVVVTLGARGSAAVLPDRTLFVPAIPAPEVVDTSGAGDCFCGVLAACLDYGTGLEQALQLGNAAASLSVRKRGAAPSMPRREDVEALISGR